MNPALRQKFPWEASGKYPVIVQVFFRIV